MGEKKLRAVDDAGDAATPAEDQPTAEEAQMIRYADGVSIESQRLAQIAALVRENVALRIQLRKAGSDQAVS